MGPAGHQITASDGLPAIFVEVVYKYKPIVSNTFAMNTTIRSTAAFSVRDNRDLQQIYQRSPGNPNHVSGCSLYDGVTTPNI